MKRSSIVTLLAVGAGGIVLYSLAGEKRGGVPDGGKAYASITECETGGDLTKEQCAKSWDDALTAHEKTAPKYTSLAECEQAHGVGQCAAPRHGDGNSYIPLMAAVMMSSLWLRQGYQPAPLLRRRGDGQGQFAFTGGRYTGAPGGGGFGGTSARSGASVSTTSRGGFGSTGGGFSAGS